MAVHTALLRLQTEGEGQIVDLMGGPSLSIPLVRGSLVLGTWQRVVLIDFADRPRERSVHIQIAS